MPVREKSDEWTDPELPPRPRASVEREVDLSHVVEGVVQDGPVIVRVTPIDTAKQRTGSTHHERHQRRRKLRVALVAGAVLLAMLPWTLRLAEATDPLPAAPVIGEDSFLTAMTVLKALTLAITLGALSWRLRRRASRGLRVGYFGGTWTMAVGFGLIAIHEGWMAGAMLFDAGAALLLLCALGDEHLRSDRATGTNATGKSA